MTLEPIGKRGRAFHIVNANGERVGKLLRNGSGQWRYTMPWAHGYSRSRSYCVQMAERFVR